MSNATLTRDLSLFDVTMIGVGAMIGAGIFVLTGSAAGVAGPGVTLAFALNGFVTLLTAIVYAELGSAIPEAGGGYLWIKEGLPGGNAFIAGWVSWFAHAVAGALYALGFGAFAFELARVLGVDWSAIGLDLEWAKRIFGLAIVAVFALINYRGSSETGKAGTIITLAKLAVIGVFCAAGLKAMFFGADAPGLARVTPLLPDRGWLDVVSAMGLTFIAFEGYEIIVQAGEEVYQPRRNLPKAILWSLAIVVPLYVLVGFVLVGASDSAALAQVLAERGNLPANLSASSPSYELLRHLGELGLARVAAQLLPYGAQIILVGGLLSTMSALNATTFSSTRVAFAMGRDQDLPDVLGSVSKRTHTPHVALLASALLMATMVAFVPLTTVAAAADIMFMLLFLQVNVAAITLRRKYGDKLGYGFINPFYPVIPIAGIVAKLGLAVAMVAHYASAWYVVAGWLAAGAVGYSLYASKRGRAKLAPPIVYEHAPLDIKRRSVLVPIERDADSHEVTALGKRLATLQDSELVLLHAIALPRQLPRFAANAEIGAARALLDRVAADTGIDARRVLRVGGRTARAIEHTTLDHASHIVVLPWDRQASRLHRPGLLHPDAEDDLDATADRVVKATRCNLVVVEDVSRSHAEVKRVLVALANPRTVPLSVLVASALVGDQPGAEIALLHVSPRALDDAAREELQADLQRQLRDGGDSGDLELGSLADRTALRLVFAESDEPPAEIARRSVDYDRLIVGFSSAGTLRRQVLGDIPRAIVHRARCPVVLVRRTESAVRFGVQSFFEYFFDLDRQGELDDEEEGDSAPAKPAEEERP